MPISNDEDADINKVEIWVTVYGQEEVLWTSGDGRCFEGEGPWWLGSWRVTLRRSCSWNRLHSSMPFALGSRGNIPFIPLLHGGSCRWHSSASFDEDFNEVIGKGSESR